jgi:tRNA-Thr(GGU) m(6)t(6)A37 methyltransferase TsaA
VLFSIPLVLRFIPIESNHDQKLAYSFAHTNWYVKLRRVFTDFYRRRIRPHSVHGGLADAFARAALRGRIKLTMQPIGTVRSPYTETKQIPKGLGVQHETEGVLEILPQYEAGLTDIEGFSHLYVLWVFDRASGYDLICSPPSDNRPHGLFATRSPRRPNPIGLTVVNLLRREGCKLHVRGVDMLDGTPIVDIKPYLSSVPAEELKRGWLAEAEARSKGVA